MGNKRKIIPNKLQRCRIIHGYTQKDVATILRFKSANIISSWELGTSGPSLENVLKLSKLYHTLPADLFSRLDAICQKEIDEGLSLFVEAKAKKKLRQIERK